MLSSSDISTFGRFSYDFVLSCAFHTDDSTFLSVKIALCCIWKSLETSFFVQISSHQPHYRPGWGPPLRLRSQKGTLQSATRPPTVHPTMEFPELGVNCSVSHCNQLDFLPVKCDACKSKFCNDHFLYDAHSCPLKHTKDAQVGQYSYSRKERNANTYYLSISSYLTRRSIPQGFSQLFM